VSSTEAPIVIRWIDSLVRDVRDGPSAMFQDWRRVFRLSLVSPIHYQLNGRPYVFSRPLSASVATSCWTSMSPVTDADKWNEHVSSIVIVFQASQFHHLLMCQPTWLGWRLLLHRTGAAVYYDHDVVVPSGECNYNITAGYWNASILAKRQDPSACQIGSYETSYLPCSRSKKKTNVVAIP